MKQDLSNRADIGQLVEAFYKQAMVDPLLGPVFEAAKLDLEAHKPVIVDFWETSIFQTNSYQRNAMKVHTDLHQSVPLSAEHFERWLALFDATVDDLFEGINAHTTKIRARSIATVMQIKIKQSAR